MQKGADQQHKYILSCSNGQTNNIITASAVANGQTNNRIGAMPCKGENKRTRMLPREVAMQGH